MKQFVLAMIMASTAWTGTLSTTLKHLESIGMSDQLINAHFTEYKYTNEEEGLLIATLENVGVPLKDAVRIIEQKRTAQAKAEKESKK